jgi:hydrogenase expression/formation protein HypC
MCLGIPARIIRIDGDFAEANINGASLKVGIQLLDHVKPGDYVLVHTGYALEIIDEKDALDTIEILRQLEQTDPDNHPYGK